MVGRRRTETPHSEAREVPQSGTAFRASTAATSGSVTLVPAIIDRVAARQAPACCNMR
jgi:hypothetical protein